MNNLSKYDRINAILFAGNAIIAMIEEISDSKPFTFAHVKDLAKKLIRSLEYNSNLMYRKNDSEEVTEYAVDFSNLCQYLINVAVIVNHRLPDEDARQFQKEFNELLTKFKIDAK